MVLLRISHLCVYLCRRRKPADASEKLKNVKMLMETKNKRYSTPVCEMILMEPEMLIALSNINGEWLEGEENWEQEEN